MPPQVRIYEVRLTDERLQHILEHPEMREMSAEIERVLRQPQLVRLSRSDTDVRLFYYPGFVSEGTSAEKVARIRHNDYLCKMYRGITQIQGSIVVFGHSLDPCDDHIFLDRIGRHGKTKLCVSIYGDPATPGNNAIIRNAMKISTLRPVRRPLSVQFFDSQSATVW